MKNKEDQKTNLHSLVNTPGARKKYKLVGRGPGSGHGKTSCRGHKGQLARAGKGKRPGFEGGQMPLYRRLPKRGFNNIFRKDYSVINLSRLNQFDDNALVTPSTLRERGLVKRKFPVKILGSGKLERKLKVTAHKFSKTAKKVIEEKGGSCKEI